MIVVNNFELEKGEYYLFWTVPFAFIGKVVAVKGNVVKLDNTYKVVNLIPYNLLESELHYSESNVQLLVREENTSYIRLISKNQMKKINIKHGNVESAGDVLNLY